MSGQLIYLIAGEPSGDALGAGLMRALKQADSTVQFAGIGGEAMQREGLESLFPYGELSIMGFLEILPHIPKLLKRIRQTTNDIIARQPAALVTIDSPGFNLRLVKSLLKQPKAAHIKRIHYVAPSVWAYKPKRAKRTANLFDRLLTLLPFEPPYFEKEGLKTSFVGHTVLWQDWEGNGKAFRKKHGITDDAKILLILPGSRAGEIKQHLQIFLDSAKTLPEFVPVILAGSLVQGMIKEMAPKEMIIADIAEKKDAFAAATIALSKSGTITLELAAAGVPMIAAHKFKALSAWIMRRMILIPYASLVNIAVNKEIVPEYIQERCNVEEISKGLVSLAKPEAQALQQRECGEAIKVLRADKEIEPDTLAARAVLECIKEKQ